MPDLDTTALIERLRQSNRRWKRLALSLLAALGLLSTSAVVLWVRAERQARQAEAAERQARQQEKEARERSQEALQALDKLQPGSHDLERPKFQGRARLQHVPKELMDSTRTDDMIEYEKYRTRTAKGYGWPLSPSEEGLGSLGQSELRR